ncbi:MAG TPA: hypothetical protein VFQ61_29505 [Polyangiaceae bacterium]|nr:hypothetical protein [Polyangiaceae bacterium]
MPTRLQWVNYPDADKTIGAIHVRRANFIDSDVGTTGVMSTTLFVRIRFQRSDAAGAATLTIRPDGGNAAYSAQERLGQPGVFAPGLTAATVVSAQGYARFRVKLTPAGGDKYRLEGRSAAGTVRNYANEVETRRKLFYQIIRMREARGLAAGMTGRVERQFWRPDKKLYIKLAQYARGHTIRNMENFDDTDPAVEARVKTRARRAYDRSKAPFAFVAIFVNKNCIPAREHQVVAANFTGAPFVLNTQRRIFSHADRAVRWFHSMTFTPAGGAPVNIPRRAVRVTGLRALTINTSSLPAGAGTLEYEITIVDIEGMGLSLPTENLVTIASRFLDGSPVPAATMAAVMVHEIGHKIGMVPGPQGDHDLDRQSTYYDGRGHSGPHCRHPAPLVPTYNSAAPLVPAPTCTMFGDIRTNTTQFCTNCVRSVRKLDLDPDRKPGIATQF